MIARSDLKIRQNDMLLIKDSVWIKFQGNSISGLASIGVAKYCEQCLAIFHSFLKSLRVTTVQINDHSQFYFNLKVLQIGPLLIKVWSLERISRPHYQWCIL